MAEALPDAGGEDEERAATARAAIAENLRLYAYLLPLHIGKEDTVLFGLTEKLLSVQELELLAEEFEGLAATPGAAAALERHHRTAHELAREPVD